MSVVSAEASVWGAWSKWLCAMKDYYLIYAIDKLGKKYRLVYPRDAVAEAFSSAFVSVRNRNKEMLVYSLGVLLDVLNDFNSHREDGRSGVNTSYIGKQHLRLMSGREFTDEDMVVLFDDIVHVSHNCWGNFSFPKVTFEIAGSDRHWNVLYTLFTFFALVFFVLWFRMHSFQVVPVFLTASMLGLLVAYYSVRYFQAMGFLGAIFLGISMMAPFTSFFGGSTADNVRPLGEVFIFVYVIFLNIGGAFAMSFLLRKVDDYGAFATLWCRKTKGKGVEFVLMDSQSKIVEARRVRFARSYLGNFYSAFYVSSIARTLRKHEGQWIVGYPALMKPRPGRPANIWKENSGIIPLDQNNVSILSRLFNPYITGGYIPGDYAGAVKFCVPNMDIDTLAQYFASNPPCCEPPGYDESVASQGVEGQ